MKFFLVLSHFRRLAFLPLLLLAIVLAACDYLPFGSTPIMDIVNNPAQYENREVKVRGVVSDVTKIPFLDLRFYTITEDNYKIPVVTKGTLPPAGSKIILDGVVENFAILGNESLGLHIREIKRWEDKLFGFLTR